MTPIFSFGRSRRKSAQAVGEEDVTPPATRPEAGYGPSAPSPVRGEAPAPPPGAADLRASAQAPYDDVPPLTPQRERLIEDALATWREELVALGGVASLDDITILDGVVDLTAAHPSGLAQLYAGRATHLSSLVRERSALTAARQSLREVAGRTDLLARQFGVAPVYLAIGVASWSEAIPSRDGADLQAEARAGLSADDIPTNILPQAATRTVNAPVLLRPVRLASTTNDATITLDPTIEANPVITRALRAAGSRADVEAVAHATLTSEGFTPRAALARIGALGEEYLPDFQVHERLVVGAFVHPGQALVEDFDATIERSRASALVAALAGDPAAIEALDVTLPDPDPVDRLPERERGVGDLDVAQLDAVEAVSSGASILLDAPPGSNVAGTLAAVVADAAASGRTVLHVPASSSDGHAVAEALRELGLGGMVLDLTEDAAWRRHAGEGIKEALGQQPPRLDIPAILEMRERLASLRAKQAGTVSALHVRRDPWGVSAYEALQQLAELTSGRARERTTARIESRFLSGLDERGLSRARDLLHTAHRLDVLTPEVSSSAWSGVDLADIDQATDALTRLSRLADELLPTVDVDSAKVAEEIGMVEAQTLAEWCEQLDMLDGVRESLDIFLPEVFERSAADMVIATASKKWREERALEMTPADRRRFVRQAKDLVRPGRPVEDLHSELVKVQQRREAWRVHNPDGGWPSLPAGLDAMQASARRARSAVEEIQPLLSSSGHAPVLMDLPMYELLERVRELADDEATAQKLPEVNRVVGELTTMGLGPLVADLSARRISASEIDSELTYCWWASLLTQLLHADANLSDLDAGILGRRAQALRELDAGQAESLAGPVAQAWARRVRKTVEENKASARALYVALSREDGVPLREIIARYPVAMVAKPVWIVPPTLVPQVLTPDALVDLAVLDASGHMPVAQVLPAFVRAEQVLVVGDPRRATTGLAAELGPLLPRVTLPTTLNTLDAKVATFLAFNGYEGVVEAVPSPPGASLLTLDLVDGRGMPAPGQSAVESVPAEVERVVDLVIDHTLTHRRQSLAVIALNARHAEEIRRAVTAAATGAPALENFFASGIAEPFVVVDLSEARSLRRDHVILSVGYAKTPHGRTIHTFGAVSDAGGMVGLVEALCASRGTTHVVSCLAPEDLEPERLHAPGARLLRELLVRAAGQEPEVEESDQVPERLLIDLAEQLWRRGLTVEPRFGVEGGVRIPLAIGHPDFPDELFVAVLTDDEDYVGEPSLRRRDRYWVERLEHRGWRVHTAFSVSVFIDPVAEARRIEDLVMEAVRERMEPVEPQGPAVPGRVEDVDPDDVPVQRFPVAEAITAAGSAESAGAASASAASGLSAASAPAPERDTRPPIAQGLPLQAYSDSQLDELVAWIRSDGVTRSEAQEVEELRATLALLRRGPGIDAVLANAVRRTR